MTLSSHIPNVLPIYPVKEQIIFPYMVLPVFFTRETTPIIEEAMRTDQLLGTIYCPGSAGVCSYDEHPRIGTVCKINQLIKFPEGGGKVTIEGLHRFVMKEPLANVPCLKVAIELIKEPEVKGLVAEALVQSVNALLKIAMAYGRPLPEDVLKMIDRIDDPGRLADMISVYMGVSIEVQQQLLATIDPIERLKSVYLHLTSEVQKLQIKGEIQSEVGKRLGKKPERTSAA